MKVAIGLAGLAAALAVPALAREAGPPVHYDLSFDNAVHNEARISVTFRDIGTAPLHLRMSRSSPGRYALHEFAKNVYSVSAVDGAGRPLEVGRADPYSWTVAGHDGTVTVSYTLYGDRGDGTYSQIDATHAHLNAPATFMWARGFGERPVTVRFRPLNPDWKIATQLRPGPDEHSFTAPDLAYLLDSPIELSDHDLREWQVEEDAGRYTIRLAVHHEGTAEELDRYAGMAKNVVREQIAVFRDVPDFDYGTYTFLADYMPQATGDGMEHRNSTYITSASSLREANFSQIGALSHELFHAWHVERLRPADLEPFDFERADPTNTLWFGEGFTHYYGPLLIHRAGEASLEAFLADLSGTLNFVSNAPGRRFASPQEMSIRAAFADGAVALDPSNHSNIFISYYPYGAIVALGLDLTLRGQFGLSLDDYMRHLWRAHGAPERPYTHEDLRRGLAELTGDRRFAEDFFARFIESSALPDFEPLLARAGLKLRRKNPGAAWAGSLQLQGENAVRIMNNMAVGSPLYEAGLERGDTIVSLGGAAVASQQAWNDAVQRRAPGDAVEIRYIQRGIERSVEIRFAEDPTIEIVPYEAVGLALTPAQQAFRAAWLGSQAGG